MLDLEALRTDWLRGTEAANPLRPDVPATVDAGTLDGNVARHLERFLRAASSAPPPRWLSPHLPPI